MHVKAIENIEYFLPPSIFRVMQIIELYTETISFVILHRNPELQWGECVQCGASRGRHWSRTEPEHYHRFPAGPPICLLL